MVQAVNRKKNLKNVLLKIKIKKYLVIPYLPKFVT